MITVEIETQLDNVLEALANAEYQLQKYKRELKTTAGIAYYREKIKKFEKLRDELIEELEEER